MKEEQNLNKIAKYLSDNSDSKERENLFAWVKEHPDNKKRLEESMEVWEAADTSKLAFQPDIDAAWNKVDKRINTARGNAKEDLIVRPISFVRPWMRVAAAAILLLGITLWFTQSESGDATWIEESTTVAEKTTIELPDGSEVWLNQNSTLKYEKHFDKRIVWLEGEAFFEIVKNKGKPFEIFAGDSKTRVLGTTFNIRAYPSENKVELTVESGKVDFSAEKEPSENAILEADEYATYTKSNQQVEKLGVAKLNAIAWKKGALRFDNTKMEEVIEALERYYDIDIEVEKSKIFNCSLNSTMTYPKPILENIFKQIEFTTSDLIRVQKKDDGVYLFSGEGCN